MRVWIGALVLCLCAWQSHGRSLDWRSNLDIWQAAASTAPTLPRPAVNMTEALIAAGQWSQAAIWARHAGELVEQPERWGTRDALRLYVRRQVQMIDVVIPLCEQPSWAFWCA